MAATYDGEDLLDSILAIMTDATALNTKIAAIEAEKTAAGKGLTPTLAAIASDSYHVQSWSDKVLQKNPAIFYGIENVAASDGGGVVAKTYSVFVEAVLVDSGQTNDSWKRISRYSRSLEELFRTAYTAAIASGRVEVKEIRPVAFKLALDSDEEVKVGGVSLTVTIV